MPKKRLNAEERGFLQGIAITLGILARDRDLSTVAADILSGMGLTLADLEASGAEEYDLALAPFRQEAARHST
jgi:hypothetical protein